MTTNDDSQNEGADVISFPLPAEPIARPRSRTVDEIIAARGQPPGTLRELLDGCAALFTEEDVDELERIVRDRRRRARE